MADDKDLTAKAMEAFKKRLTRQAVTSLQVCVHCGQCAESCHYYLATEDPRMAPVYKMDRVRKVYKRTVDWLGRVAPGWVGAQDLDEDLLKEWVELAYGACTMCRRCWVNCPMGVDPAQILGLARGVLTELGMTPKGLQATINVHLEHGNNMGISEEDFVETLQWMEEELQAEVGDPSARIPINKPNARVVYTFNPREVKYFPHLIQAAAKIFNAAGEDWTVSTEGWDATNYALFAFDPATGYKLAKRVEDAVNHLGAKVLAMAECGHGFRSQRWEGESWGGHRYPFEVLSFVELQAQYIREGRIKLDPTVNAKRVTYHDPCNQARSGGVVEEPRYILRHAVMDFVEMEPHGVDNFCCGGGGGMLSMTEFARQRIAAGKIKAEQIKATGAQIVATSCHNCLDQLAELSKHYKLGVKVHNLSELVAAAIVWEKKEK
ncbi:MAG: (Fe-S)-binding protein [Anaerolineae bacterium]|nr:(Fe-S)-binding protein [Anaerolineae bacterium]